MIFHIIYITCVCIYVYTYYNNTTIIREEVIDLGGSRRWGIVGIESGRRNCRNDVSPVFMYEIIFKILDHHHHSY